MDDSLGGGHVDALHREANVLSIGVGADRSAGVLDPSLEFALDRLVALGALGVGQDALLLGLDVCHVNLGAIDTAP